MITEVQFDSPLLRETIRGTEIEEVAIEQLDAASQVPLRTVCWLENGHAEAFEARLEGDRTVIEATKVIETDRGRQYDVQYREREAEAAFYEAAVEEGGIFVSGHRYSDHWEVEFRFPDREAFAAFQNRCERADIDPEIQAIHDREVAPSAEQYGVSDPQREILLLAAREGFFDVPRRASLADLADALDVSSQAASERLRRGLDSLVGQTLLTPE